MSYNLRLSLSGDDINRSELQDVTKELWKNLERDVDVQFEDSVAPPGGKGGVSPSGCVLMNSSSILADHYLFEAIKPIFGRYLKLCLLLSNHNNGQQLVEAATFHAVGPDATRAELQAFIDASNE